MTSDISPQEFAPLVTPVIAPQGLHVLHLYYHIDHGLWEQLDDTERGERRARFLATIDDIRRQDGTQLLVFTVVTSKADVGFMLLTPDLQRANEFEMRISLSLGADLLVPAYSYLSMTELSEYTTSEEQYAAQVQDEEGLAVGSPEMEAKLEEFRARMKKYNQDRLYPNMAEWPVLCFYPMSKRRNVEQNWYANDYETRRKLMGGHARTGRKWAGKIRQLITGSTGLDLHEWGVTLLAHNTFDVKGIVYEMRFDEVSAIYAEFGDFYIGLQLPPAEVLSRLQLA